MVSVELLDNSSLCKKIDFAGKSVSMNICQTKEHTIHFHSNLEIVYVFKGTVEIIYCFEKYVVYEGNIAIINPYELHSIKSIKQSATIVYMHFDNTIFHGLESVISWNPHELTEDIIAYNSARNNVIRIIELMNENQNYEAVMEAANSIVTILKENYKWVLCVQEPSAVARDNVSYKLELVDGVIRYVYRWLDEKISLERVAGEFNVDKYYLSHAVSEVFGMSFKTFLNKARAEKAAAYLLESKASISEVSDRVGFSSVQFFNRIFNTYFGMTPSNYRKTKTPDTIRYKGFDEKPCDIVLDGLNQRLYEDEEILINSMHNLDINLGYYDCNVSIFEEINGVMINKNDLNFNGNDMVIFIKKNKR